jgi:hypothetical protein
MAYKAEGPGSEGEWQNDLFDCFSGADNLCKSSLSKEDIHHNLHTYQVSRPLSAPASCMERS